MNEFACVPQKILHKKFSILATLTVDGCVQGFKDASEQEEVSILDYKYTQYRLIRQLSFAVANKLACNFFLSKIGAAHITVCCIACLLNDCLSM